MLGILADNDVDGHWRYILELLQQEPWREFWAEMGFAVHTFETLGLPRDTCDSELWRECQKRQIILITGNRNRAGPDSLEAEIQTHNSSGCLPVLTLANRQRILRDTDYAQRTAERLLEYLFDIDKLRGAGRLYVP